VTARVTARVTAKVRARARVMANLTELMREPGNGWPFASARSERTERSHSFILAIFPGVAPPLRRERWYALFSMSMKALRYTCNTGWAGVRATTTL
jgi:hypothetical protein